MPQLHVFDDFADAQRGRTSQPCWRKQPEHQQATAGQLAVTHSATDFADITRIGLAEIRNNAGTQRIQLGAEGLHLGRRQLTTLWFAHDATFQI